MYQVLEHEEPVIDNGRYVFEVLDDGVDEVVVGREGSSDGGLQVDLVGYVEVGGPLEDGMEVKHKEGFSHLL